MDPRKVEQEQLRAVKELVEAKKEAEDQNVKDKDGELRDSFEECEARIKKLMEQNEEYAEKEKDLTARVTEKVKSNKQMIVVLEEYEKTISSLIEDREAESERWAEERAMLMQDVDETASQLASVEDTFNALHTMYERCKGIIQGCKSNENTLKQSVESYTDAIQKLEARYEALQQHAMQQLDKANLELDAVKKAQQAEVLKLHATLKESIVRASSLQESLAEKMKDYAELTAICDELISKVG